MLLKIYMHECNYIFYIYNEIFYDYVNNNKHPLMTFMQKYTYTISRYKNTYTYKVISFILSHYMTTKALHIVVSFH